MANVIVTTQPELKAIIEQILKELLSQQLVPPKSQSEIFTIEEASKYLKIPQGTIYQIVHRRELSFTKAGRSLRFFKEDLDKYLSQKRKSSKQEILTTLNTKQYV